MRRMLIMSKFLETVFLPALLAKIEDADSVFLDALQASGCSLRGSSQALVEVGSAIQNLLRQFYMDTIEGDGRGRMPTASMCMVMMGEWTVVDYKHKKFGDVRMASGLVVAQADAGIAHDAAIAQIIAWRDHQAGQKALGGVRVETIESGTGKSVSVLCNQGFALSETVVAEYLSVMRAKAGVKKFYLDRHKAASVFSTYRLSSDMFEVVAVIPHNEEKNMSLFVKVGSPSLNGSSVNLYELLDPATEAAQLIRSEVLTSWAGG